MGILPPEVDSPSLGYVEFAGWVPGNTQVLVARENEVDERYRQRFEILRRESLGVEKQADKPNNLSLFDRWQDPVGSGQTVSIR